MAKARRASSEKRAKAQASAQRSGPSLSPGSLVAGGFLLLLGAWHFLFGGFFPNPYGGVGDDFTAEATYRLAGYFWLHVNGLFAVPWFTPAFCGGLPMFGDPQTAYYSIPQLFAAFTDPISATYLTGLLSISAGFWGMWLLLRAVFHTGRGAAFLGSALFMFNGFFAHRLIMGHVIFHGFMLLPLLLYFLLKTPPETQPKARRAFSIAIDSLVCGLIVGYWVQSGMASMIPPAVLTALAVILLFGALGGSPRFLLLRAGPAALIALGLSAAKLSAGLAFLSHFERSSYVLPQTGHLYDSLRIVLETLFLSPADIQTVATALLVRQQWEVARWEWEYGVTAVPLVILLGAAALAFKRPRIQRTRSKVALACAVALVALLFLPIALNTYGETWFAIMKRLPLIKSTSVLFRWIIIYIPIVVAGSAVALERTTLSPRVKTTIALGGVGAMLIINASTDRGTYLHQGYSPEPVISAFNQVSRGEVTPHISGIDAVMNEKNEVSLTATRNDSMTRSLSQLACYNAIFGYRLETFPFRTLHPGDALDTAGGVLNVKNPACYSFPEENQCAPGDHFQLSERASAEAFLAYKPFPFEFSRRQKIANAVTEVTLLLVIGFTLFAAGVTLRRRVTAKTG